MWATRIVGGTRTPTMPALLQIAWATGATVAALTGTGAADRIEWVTHARMAPAAVEAMQAELAAMLELNSYLEGQAIPAGV